MEIDLVEPIALPAEVVYGYHQTPSDWPRLYPAFGKARALPDRWFAVPFNRFPFPLVARITHDIANREVRWEFRGSFVGEGGVSLEPTADGVVVRVHERVHLARGPRLLRRWIDQALQPRFVAVWAAGFRRLRRQEKRSEGHHAAL